MANSIYPPVLPSKQYSFIYRAVPGANKMKIQFEMPAMTNVNANDGHCQVSIKYSETGKCAIGDGYSPDRATLFITAKQTDGAGNINPYFHPVSGIIGNVWEVCIPYWAFEGGNVKANTTYSIQIRFGGKELWTGYADWGLGKGDGFANFAAWRAACTTYVPSLFGEWSNTTKIFCYGEPSTNFEYNFKNFLPQLCWTYDPSGDDPIAQVTVNYKFSNINGVQEVSQIFSGTTAKDNQFTLQEYLPVAPFLGSITGTISALTQNNTLIEQDFIIPPISIVDPPQEDKAKGKFTVWDNGEVQDLELSSAETEDGIIGKILIAKDDLSEVNNQTVNIYRCDLLTLNTVKIVSNLAVINGQKTKVKDFTVCMGDQYEYVFCIMDANNELSKFFISPVSPYGEGNPGYARLMRMDAAFLTDTNHQLKVIGNLKISSFKRNTSDNFQTTIGAKYPFYSRNSKQNYRTLQLSAAVSINFDPTATFLRFDPDNGLFWDSGTNSAIEFTDPSLTAIVQTKTQLLQYEQQYEAQKARMNTANYINNPDVRMDVDTKLAYYYALMESTKELLATYSNTRGSTELWILDSDLYSKTAISLSRRRVKDPAGFDTIVQESAEDPYGYGDASMLNGPQTVFSPMLHKEGGVQYDTSSSDRMVYLERRFRDKVMEWISDGKPKLFRSENEGNMIVMVSGASFAPLDKTDRKIYTLTCTLTEIADYNLQNLIDYKLIPCVIESDMDDINPYAFTPGNADPNIKNQLGFLNMSPYYLPDTQINTTFTESIVDAVVNNLGTPGTTLIFDKEDPLGVPNPITISNNGIITWTPTAVSDTRLQTVKVTDTILNQTVKATLVVGKAYTPLVMSTYATIPAKKIGDTINIAGGTASGGFGNITYYASNLPSGVTIDKVTGAISGTLLEEAAYGKTAIIMAKDEKGNEVSQILSFTKIGAELTFAGDYVYEIPVGEENVAISEIALYGNVSGGQTPYTFSLNPVTGGTVPAGITINAVSGVISGAPTTANPSACEFLATVTDANGDSRSIHITMKKVVEAFRITNYKWQMDATHTILSTDKTYNFRMEYDATTNVGSLVPLPVGAKSTGAYWVNIMSTTMPGGQAGIVGGEPFEGDNGPYYIFESTGLQPNFSIDAKTGIITGVPGVGQPGGAIATVKAKDQRGKYAKDAAGNDYITILISPVTQDMTIKSGTGEFTLPSTLRGNLSNHNGTLVPYLNYDYGFSFDLSNIEGGIMTGNFSIANNVEWDPNDFPTGVELVLDTTSTPGKRFLKLQVQAGAELGVFAPKVSYIYITDNSSPKQRVALRVNIKQIFERLSWVQTETKVPSSTKQALYCGDALDFAFTGINGGKPNYTFTEITTTATSNLLAGITVKKPENNVNLGSGFIGTVGLPKNTSTNVVIRCSDNLGQYVDTKFTFCPIYYHIEIKVNKVQNADGVVIHDMRNYDFIVGQTIVKQPDLTDPYQEHTATPDPHKILLQPIIVTGGSGNYSYEVIQSEYGDPFGGLLLKGDGYLVGQAGNNYKVISQHPLSVNLKNKIKVTDLTLGEIVYLEDDCWSSPIYLPPELIQTSPYTIQTTTGRPITEVQMFNVHGNTNISYGEGGRLGVGPLIDGIGFNEQQTFKLSGKPAFGPPAGYQSLIWVKINANNWTEDTGALAYQECIILYDIAATLGLTITESIGPIAIGDPIPTFTIARNTLTAPNFTSGGTEPITFTWAPYNTDETIDPGFNFVSSGNVLTITGSPTVSSYGYDILITATDASNAVATAKISYHGAYKKLTFVDSTDFDIPAMVAGQGLTKVIDFIQNNPAKGVFGGEGGYTFNYNMLAAHGTYSIDATSGLLTGNASTYASAEGDVQITVSDNRGQSASITIHVGEVYGPMTWSSTRLRTGESTHITRDSRGTAFADIHLADGCLGGYGAKQWRFSATQPDANWPTWQPYVSLAADGTLSGTRPPVILNDTTFFYIEVYDAITPPISIQIDADYVIGMRWTDAGTDFGTDEPETTSVLSIGTITGVAPFTVTITGAYAAYVTYNAATGNLILTRPAYGVVAGDVQVTVSDSGTPASSMNKTYTFVSDGLIWEPNTAQMHFATGAVNTTQTLDLGRVEGNLPLSYSFNSDKLPNSCFSIVSGDLKLTRPQISYDAGSVEVTVTDDLGFTKTKTYTYDAVTGMTWIPGTQTFAAGSTGEVSSVSLGSVAGHTPLTWTSSSPWATVTGNTLKFTRPTTPQPAGSFTLTVTDNEGNGVTKTYTYGAIT